MNLSPEEAKEALKKIEQTSQKTHRSLAASGASIFLIITGLVWMIGFVSTQFLTGSIVPVIWVSASLIGSTISIIMGRTQGPRVRGPSISEDTRRAIIFWISLVFFCVATIAVVHPSEGKQITMIIILFMMIGQFSMGLLLSFTASWWAIPITALVLAGYFLLPAYFYLWMGVLVGGSMAALGFYIRKRW